LAHFVVKIDDKSRLTNVFQYDLMMAPDNGLLFWTTSYNYGDYDDKTAKSILLLSYFAQ